jgi:hypothetical protein
MQLNITPYSRFFSKGNYQLTHSQIISNHCTGEETATGDGCGARPACKASIHIRNGPRFAGEREDR